MTPELKKLREVAYKAAQDHAHDMANDPDYRAVVENIERRGATVPKGKVLIDITFYPCGACGDRRHSRLIAGDLREARARWLQFVADNNLGASQVGEVVVYNDRDRRVGVFSYNGRLWSGYEAGHTEILID